MPHPGIPSSGLSPLPSIILNRIHNSSLRPTTKRHTPSIASPSALHRSQSHSFKPIPNNPQNPRSATTAAPTLYIPRPRHLRQAQHPLISPMAGPLLTSQPSTTTSPYLSALQPPLQHPAQSRHPCLQRFITAILRQGSKQGSAMMRHEEISRF